MFTTPIIAASTYLKEINSEGTTLAVVLKLADNFCIKNIKGFDVDSSVEFEYII